MTAIIKRLFVLLLAILLSLSLCGCYTDVQIDKIKQEMYDNGVSDGFDEGKEVGRQEGYDEGHDIGYDSGYATGYHNGYMDGDEDGYTAGYKVGYDDARQAKSTSSTSSSYDSEYNFDVFGHDPYEDESSNSQYIYEENTNYSYTVYITETGSKYHSWGCQYLSKSCYAISMDEALSMGYSPCSRCW